MRNLNNEIIFCTMWEYNYTNKLLLKCNYYFSWFISKMTITNIKYTNWWNFLLNSMFEWWISMQWWKMSEKLKSMWWSSGLPWCWRWNGLCNCWFWAHCIYLWTLFWYMGFAMCRKLGSWWWKIPMSGTWLWVKF